MDNAQVTQNYDDMAYAKSIVEAVEKGCTYEDRCLAVRDLLARHRLERSEPVGCQYPVHGSVTHVRNVECCDFCGHPADTTPPEPVAEIERLRELLREAAKGIATAFDLEPVDALAPPFMEGEAASLVLRIETELGDAL